MRAWRKVGQMVVEKAFRLAVRRDAEKAVHLVVAMAGQ